MDLHGRIMNLPQKPGLPMVNATERSGAGLRRRRSMMVPSPSPEARAAMVSAMRVQIDMG